MCNPIQINEFYGGSVLFERIEKLLTCPVSCLFSLISFVVKKVNCLVVWDFCITHTHTHTHTHTRSLHIFTDYLISINLYLGKILFFPVFLFTGYIYDIAYYLSLLLKETKEDLVIYIGNAQHDISCAECCRCAFPLNINKRYII